MRKSVKIERLIDNRNDVYGHYTMTLRDRNGNIVKQGKYEVHSFVNQYWSILRRTMASDGTATLTSMNSGPQPITLLQLRSGNGGSFDARGIVVGTSSAAVEYSQTSLGGFVESGNNANQLFYSSAVTSYDESTGTATITQTFTNNNITTEPTINEVGIALHNDAQEGAAILVARDVPGSSYAMLYLSVLTVTYEIQFPFGTQNFGMLFAKHQIARNTSEMNLYNATGDLISATTFGAGAGALGFVGSVGQDYRGIVVGDGNASEDFNTFALDSQIVHGSNAGELFHFDSTISSLEVIITTTNQSAFYLSRAFKNRTGTAINIVEVGIMSNATIGATNSNYLFDRRLLASNIVVDPQETVTITWGYIYTFT